MYIRNVGAEHGLMTVRISEGILSYAVYVGTSVSPGVHVGFESYPKELHDIVQVIQGICDNLRKLNLEEDAEQLSILIQEFDTRVVPRL